MSKFTVRDKPMTFEELLVEIRWLMSFDVSPEDILQTLGLHQATILRRIDRRPDWAENQDIVEYFIWKQENNKHVNRQDPKSRKGRNDQASGHR